MNNLYKTSKEISLLIGGSILGLIFTYFEDSVSKNLVKILIILMILIFYGIGILDGVTKLYFWSLKKLNKRLRLICFYEPYQLNADNSSWVETELKKIKKFLKKEKIKYRVNRTERAFDKYPIVINPYGGVYPEEDLNTLRSLGIIFSYVRDGGVYINIADIPFYYAYDKNLHRRIDTTPLANNFSLARSFLKTLLTEKLNLYVFAITKGSDYSIGVTRVIQLTKTTHNLYNKSQFDDGPSGDYSPVLKIPYGRGYFIFSTFLLTDKNFEKHISRLIYSIR